MDSKNKNAFDDKCDELMNKLNVAHSLTRKGAYNWGQYDNIRNSFLDISDAVKAAKDLLWKMMEENKQ